MPVNKDENQSNNKNNKAMLVGYQVAVSLMSYEGSLLWSRFNTMLTGHSIFLIVVGFFIKDSSGFTGNVILFLILSIVGLVLCFMWFQMTSRGFAIIKYHTLSARELEEKIRDPKLMTLKRGYDFSKDEIVPFDLPKPNKYHQRPWFARFIKTEHAAYVSIGVFVLIYIVIFVVSLTALINYQSCYKSNYSFSKFSDDNCKYLHNRAKEIPINKWKNF